MLASAVISAILPGDALFVLGSIRSRRAQRLARRETLDELRFVHHDRALGVLDCMNDKAKLQKALGALQRLVFTTLDRPAPSLAAAAATHVPPDRIAGVTGWRR